MPYRIPPQNGGVALQNGPHLGIPKGTGGITLFVLFRLSLVALCLSAPKMRMRIVCTLCSGARIGRLDA